MREGLAGKIAGACARLLRGFLGAATINHQNTKQTATVYT